MDEYLSSLTALEWVFLISAIVGSCLFLVRLVLMVMGAHGDADVGDADVGDVHVGDVHADVHGDVHADAHDSAISDADADVKLLSFQGITAFFMMFGLVGLGCLRGGFLGSILSLSVACLAGLATAWVTGYLFMLMVRMQSSGTLDLYGAFGEEGTVYLTIPPDGQGKVQVTVQERLLVLNAVSQNNEEIKTGERVKVVDLSGPSVLVVQRSES